MWNLHPKIDGPYFGEYFPRIQTIPAELVTSDEAGNLIYRDSIPIGPFSYLDGQFGKRLGYLW